ncbi:MULTISPECIES: MFS transporter [unclassified Streptomyces]|uniref:MFS transporter n=1 Tax=unclassified Streptomyces TaxID=2593676 RepID=UPI00336ADF26
MAEAARPATAETHRLGRPVYLLTLCQFLYYAGVSVDLTLTAVVGLEMAPAAALATVPLTLMTVTGTIASYATGMLSARYGHRTVLAVGACIAVTGGLVSMLAVQTDSFLTLCVGTAMVGVYRSTGGYFRFLAADLVPKASRTRALSTVLCGGVAAAIVGPWAATESSGLMGAEFAGSYLLVSCLAFAVVPVILAVRPASPRPTEADADAEEEETAQATRVRDVVHTSDFRRAFSLLAVSTGVMTMLMAVGPIGSKHAGHSLSQGAMIIQWHMVGMFAPALFSGRLTTAWGPRWTGTLGAFLLVTGAGIGSLGTGMSAFMVSLGLVGVGWNLAYVSGSAYAVRCYPQGKGGRVQATIEGSTACVGAVASFSANMVFSQLGWTGTNLAALVLPLIVCVWLALARNSEREPATA